MANLSKYIAIAIIFSISVLAFIGGYYQGNLEVLASNKRTTINQMQEDVMRMESRAQLLITSDIEMISLSQKIFIEARQIDNQLSVINDTLTIEERTNLINQILGALGAWRAFMEITHLSDICDHFGTTNDDYYLAKVAIDGYEYKIARDQWFDENGIPPMTSRTPNQLIGTESFLQFFAYQDILAEITENINDINWPVTDHLNRLLYEPIIQKQNEIQDLREDLNAIETQLRRLTYGISLITVMVILSAAMGSRLDARGSEHEFSKLSAIVNPDEVKIIPPTDNIAMLILYISLILALIGLLMPFFFQYFLS